MGKLRSTALVPVATLAALLFLLAGTTAPTHLHAAPDSSAAAADAGRANSTGHDRDTLLPVADAAPAPIAVENAFARQTVGKSRASAVFMTLHNHGHNADRLIGVRTPAAGKTAMHRSSLDASGVTTMRAVAAVELPAGGVVELKPGGLHIMMTKLNRLLEPGMELSLTLIFETAGEITVTVPVRPIGHGAGGHGRMEHGHMSSESGNSGLLTGDR